MSWETSLGLSIPFLVALLYRCAQMVLDCRRRRQRADAFYHWAMAIGRRRAWSKGPPIAQGHLQDGHIIQATVSPHLADHTD